MSLIEKELINALRERDEARAEAADLRRERDELNAEVDRITEAGRVHIRRAAAFEAQRDGLADALVELRDRYQLLCANCNFGKLMNGGVCPHKTAEAANA